MIRGEAHSAGTEMSLLRLVALPQASHPAQLRRSPGSIAVKEAAGAGAGPAARPAQPTRTWRMLWLCTQCGPALSSILLKPLPAQAHPMSHHDGLCRASAPLIPMARAVLSPARQPPPSLKTSAAQPARSPRGLCLRLYQHARAGPGGQSRGTWWPACRRGEGAQTNPPGR